MQIVLALLIGAAIGFTAEYVLPGRETRGAALAPALGAAVGGVVWAALTWAGLGFDHPVIWAVSVLAPVVVVPAVLVLLTRMRTQADAAERRRLRIG